MKPAAAALRRGLPICIALFTLLAQAQGFAAPADEVSQIFGSRVEASSRFPAPYASGDFDGDGKADAVYLVTVLPASAKVKLAKDVHLIGKLFGSKPLGARGEDLALAILQGGGKRKFLFTGYLGEGVSAYFDSPMWSTTPVPLSVAKRGSKPVEEFRQKGAPIKHDIVVVGTEAGIDTALYWTGTGYALFRPVEEP